MESDLLAPVGQGLYSGQKPLFSGFRLFMAGEKREEVIQENENRTLRACNRVTGAGEIRTNVAGSIKNIILDIKQV